MKTVKALVGDAVVKSARCCGESGTLGVTRPDISTQVRFRKEEELRKDETALRAIQAAQGLAAPDADKPGKLSPIDVVQMITPVLSRRLMRRSEIDASDSDAHPPS